MDSRIVVRTSPNRVLYTAPCRAYSPTYYRPHRVRPDQPPGCEQNRLARGETNPKQAQECVQRRRDTCPVLPRSGSSPPTLGVRLSHGPKPAKKQQQRSEWTSAAQVDPHEVRSPVGDLGVPC
eukprot:9472337-Pyramimonas_sp.AAC.1